MSAGDTTDPFAAIHAARPGPVAAAADGWRLAAARLTELRDELAETARLGTRVWSGGGAERFTARCHALAAGADRLAGQGTALHEHLTEAAHALARARKSATDPRAAEAALAQLEAAYRDLGERLPLLPCAPADDGVPSRPTTTLTTTAPADAPPPSRPCATTAPPGVDPDIADPAATVTEAAGADPTPPPTPADPTTPCAPPTPDALAAPPPAPPAQPPPPTAPLATCIAATTPPTTPPAPGPPPIACPPQAAMPTALTPAVVGTPLPRDPRPVQPAGIGPRLRRAAPPPSTPIAPVTGIRIAPGLRGGTGDHPAATHDAAHTADPTPNVLGTTTRDGTPTTPVSPTWVTAPTTGGTPTTPVRPRRSNRYATHPAQAWSTPEEPPEEHP